MSTNFLKEKFKNMCDIIFKHCPITQLSEKEQMSALITICKKLDISQNDERYLIRYRNLNENLMKIQDYYIERLTFKQII